MVSKKEIVKREEQMFSYLSGKLHLGKAELLHTKVSGFDYNPPFLMVQQEGEKGIEKKVVILLPAHVAHQEDIMSHLRIRSEVKGFGPAAFLFYKEGKEFFRNGAESNEFKRKYGLSLKHYSQQEVGRMIEMTKEENFVRSNRRGFLQYYQPKSDRLDEKLVSMQFSSVRFDYSYLGEDRYIPENKNSERLFIWDNRTRKDSDGPFIIDGGYVKTLKPKPEIIETPSTA